MEPFLILLVALGLCSGAVWLTRATRRRTVAALVGAAVSVLYVIGLDAFAYHVGWRYGQELWIGSQGRACRAAPWLDPS